MNVLEMHCTYNLSGHCALGSMLLRRAFSMHVYLFSLGHGNSFSYLPAG